MDSHDTPSDDGLMPPPHKRAAPEATAPQRQRQASALSARARFQQELQQYASDSDDEGEEKRGGVVADGWRGRGGQSLLGASRMPHAHRVTGEGVARSNPGALPYASTASLSVAAAAPSSADTSDFFFGGSASQAGAEAEEGTQSLQNGFNHSGAPSRAPASALPSKVGLSLLHRMHQDSSESTTSARLPSEAQPQSSARAARTAASPSSPTAGGFEVVHAYVPLSSGGFLSTASALEDAMEGHHVRVGDVLALRKAPGAATTTTTATTSLRQPVTAAAGPAAPSFSSAPSPTTPSPPSPPAEVAGVSDVARRVMGHFKAAAAFTTEEKKFGRSLSPEMVRLLFEVTRVDRPGRSVEALFLDGTRAKLAFSLIRPAGYVERGVYAQWKADPASRPVTKMHSGPASPASASAPGTHPGSPVSAVSSPTTATTRDAVTNPAAGVAKAEEEWWVIPRLLVRVATEGAGDWYGKKCVVKAVRRGDDVIRLTEWQEDTNDKERSRASPTASSPSSPSAPAVPETRELVGVGGLETVVPKKGGRAMVVLGPRRGEMCTVRCRVRGPDGELAGVEVEMNRTKEVVTLKAEELCALAR